MRLFRKLWLTERKKLAEHLLRLDAEDRHLRFGYYVTDTRVAQYCTEIDWFRTIVVGCFIDGELRGMAELKKIDGAWPSSAEVAVTVEKPCQDQGIGTELLQRLITIAHNRSIRSLYMICLIDNQRVQRLTRKFGTLVTRLSGEAEGRLEVGWPSYQTVLQEAVDDGSALLQSWLEPMFSIEPVAAARLSPG